MRIICVVALVAVLSGCGQYRQYERPAMELDAMVMYGNQEAVDTTLASMDWRELFNDARLQQLISTGLERNTDLAIARLETEVAKASLSAARLAYLPSLSLDPQAGVSHYNGATKRTYNVGGSASWEIETFGRLTNQKRMAVSAVEQARAYEQAVLTELVATIAESYYTLLLLDKQLEIADSTLVNWRSTITMMEALVAAGRSNGAAVHQAKANLTALEASRVTIESNIAHAEVALCSLLKESPHAIERGTLDEQSFPEDIRVGVPLEWLATRPDVRQAEAALAKAYYNTNVARAAFYPSLTLSGTLGWTNSSGGSVVNPGKLLSSAVAALAMPIFDRGTNKANLRIAQVQQREAGLRFEQTLLEAGAEVNDALTDWQTADSRIELDKRQIYNLLEAVHKTELLVRYSTSTYLEVLTAQQSLLSAQLTLAQDQTAQIDAIIALFRVMSYEL